MNPAARVVALLVLVSAPAVSTQVPDPPSVDTALGQFSARVLELRTAFHADPARPQDPEWVKAKLAHMVEVDQYMRGYSAKPQEWGWNQAETQRFMNRFLPYWREIDGANTEDLKMLLALHGWFKISSFGEEADHQAWLLVQHADHDPGFQREVLELLEGLLQEKETKPANFAYLYDRVASAEDRPQRYGTQGRCVAPGTWEPNELEDPGRVDELRASVGLGPLAEYKAVFVDLCP